LKAKIVKLLLKKIGEYLVSLVRQRFSFFFFKDNIEKAVISHTHTKLNLNSLKLKNFYSSKCITKGINRWAKTGRNLNGLRSKIKNLYNSIIKKQQQQK